MPYDSSMLKGTPPGVSSLSSAARILDLRIFAGYVVLHANIVYRNIKNRTVCFQERFRLLSLAAVLRKHPS